MKPLILFLLGFWALIPLESRASNLSQETEACLGCHATVLPGVYGDWLRSAHSRMSPMEGLQRPKEQRRVSATEFPVNLELVRVGCAECHISRDRDRPDSFDHNGFRIHTVVSPRDCAVCHPLEAQQFQGNIMSRAHGNLMGNPLFSKLVGNAAGLYSISGASMNPSEPDWLTLEDSCLSCHGTRVEFQGLVPRDTVMGEMELPAFKGWPNQGVGRINPDGSKGSCSACHTRHAFSIAVARKPHTCSQCHKGPDVPAYAVYQVSKHGNIYSSNSADWDFKAVPWRVGKDLQAPTCAACHVSMLADPEGQVLVERTHKMNDRLPWRLFGLIYAHRHPKDPDTTVIRNNSGLPLPTELTGESVSGFLIDDEEFTARIHKMERVCSQCHHASWVHGHFRRLHQTIATTNSLTLAATQLLLDAWKLGLASRENPFDEPIERRWVEQWLFFANSTRFASAMAGADYGVFSNGRWNLSRNLLDMWEWLRDRRK